MTASTFRFRSAFPDPAVKAKVSAALEPVKDSVSLSAWPSTMSLPSPGRQTAASVPRPSKSVSFPAPPTIWSAPRLPFRTSLPAAPTIVSGPEPPVSLSLPNPPFNVVASSFVNAPLRSLIVTVSLPPPALTTIEVNRLRANANSTEPFEPTSTLEDALLALTELERDLVGLVRARDCQRSAGDLRLDGGRGGSRDGQSHRNRHTDKCHSSHEQRKIRYSGANLQTLAARRSATRLTSQSANTA